MKFTSTPVLALAAAASTATAQTAPTYTNQSAPFSLQIANSANASLNNLYLFACHSGAAEEGICLGGSTPSTGSASSTFYFNTSSSASEDDGSGLLVWNLPVQLPDADHVSQPADLRDFRVGTNVVVPYFGFADGTPMHFTDDGKLVIVDWYDDSGFQAGVYPDSTPSMTTYNNWYVCWTRVGNYYYQALAWVTAGAPHDPTCQKVDVVKSAAP
jgi:hypothetical protein